ncbi:Fc.00g050070.m01.CDS01 [Cosmosporella sp. VM-42]
MLGKNTEANIKKDLQDSKTARSDAFALNIGCIGNDWVGDVLGYMLNNAAAAANDYTDFWNKYKGLNDWFNFNGKNLVSTNWSAVEFTDWRDDWDDGNLFFMPDFDHTEGYWQAAPGWWEHWGAVINGIVSWESSWPNCGGYGANYPGDISTDMVPYQGTLAHKKDVDGVCFAVVMNQGLSAGYTLKIWSGNTETPAVYSLKAGLNYGSAEALNKGAQFLEILDPSGKRVAYFDGGISRERSRGHMHTVAQRGGRAHPGPRLADGQPIDPNNVLPYTDDCWQQAQGCYIIMSGPQFILDIGEAAIPEAKVMGEAMGMAIDAAKLAAYVYDESEDQKGSGKKGDEGNPKDKPK